MLSAKNREDLAGFLRQSVLPATSKINDWHWRLWVEFLSSEIGVADPFLRNVSEGEKPGIVSLFIFRAPLQGSNGRDRGNKDALSSGTAADGLLGLPCNHYDTQFV